VDASEKRMASTHPDSTQSAEREHFAALVEAVARSEDRGAFAELFAFYAPRIKRYMMRLGAADALADELAQEVMLTLWRKADQFDREQASVSTWIFRIARNRRIDAHRRTQTARFDPDEPSLMPSAEIDPETRVNAQQLEVKVREALVGLPDEQLSLLKAAFYEGLSHREIAEREGLALGTVKSRIRLAFQKLRPKLEGDL